VGVRFRILGPLLVRSGAGWLPVPAEQQRLVLAMLLADAGRAVSIDHIVDALWGDRPPRRAVNTVQAYVLRLRRRLGDGTLVTRGRGYELLVGDNDLDAAVFERLVTAGRRELDRGRAEAGAARLVKALALWRGPAFADVPVSPSLAARAMHLEQLRLIAEEDRAGALLDLGRQLEVVDDLRRLVDESPLRERRWALLMRALDGCGRRAEALHAFHRARRVLRAELGLEPGPQLREVQRAILTGSGSAAPEDAVPARVVPAQLPADVSGFTGRDGPIDLLDALLRTDGEDAGTAAVVAAIAGTAGVGKTALAVHWAHRVRDRFGDGQLYVDLRGRADGPPVRPIEALARFLRALDVPPEQIPSDVDEAGALYRSLLARRRVLVLLDNAHDAEQVRPLLPGHPHCIALVTSRDRLGGLIARDGATPLPLDALTGGEARALLARLLGGARVADEPAAVADLAAVCDNLPLALRIAAANLSARPRTGIAGYVRRLRADRLGGLEAGGDGVRAAFDLSYAALPDPARRLFRLLGVVPGRDISVPAAAALAGARPAEAEPWLERLAIAHLVQEHAFGRYTLHDLLRRYAAERAQAEEPETERRRALDRLYRYHQRGAGAAAAVLTETGHRPGRERAGALTELARRARTPR
jgi:DNA-binding SARP family transcriptional activator